jgi:hypothetical protein
MSHALRTLLAAAICSTLLSGCTGNRTDRHDGTSAGKAPAADWGTDPAPAAGSGNLGTACALPVSFALARAWKPATVPAGVADQGGFALRCEIDAKPAGHLGFLRVWVDGKAGENPAAALDAFLAGEPGVLGRQTRASKAGTLPAAEATYLTDNADLGAHRQERLLAVATAKGTVILAVGGVSLDEHRALLPAYVLARQTVTAT